MSSSNSRVMYHCLADICRHVEPVNVVFLSDWKFLCLLTFSYILFNNVNSLIFTYTWQCFIHLFCMKYFDNCVYLYFYLVHHCLGHRIKPYQFSLNKIPCKIHVQWLYKIIVDKAIIYESCIYRDASCMHPECASLFEEYLIQI